MQSVPDFILVWILIKNFYSVIGTLAHSLGFFQYLHLNLNITSGISIKLQKDVSSLQPLMILRITYLSFKIALHNTCRQ